MKSCKSQKRVHCFHKYQIFTHKIRPLYLNAYMHSSRAQLKGLLSFMPKLPNFDKLLSSLLAPKTFHYLQHNEVLFKCIALHCVEIAHCFVFWLRHSLRSFSGIQKKWSHDVAQCKRGSSSSSQAGTRMRSSDELIGPSQCDSFGNSDGRVAEHRLLKWVREMRIVMIWILESAERLAIPSVRLSVSPRFGKDTRYQRAAMLSAGLSAINGVSSHT